VLAAELHSHWGEVDGLSSTPIAVRCEPFHSGTVSWVIAITCQLAPMLQLRAGAASRGPHPDARARLHHVGVSRLLEQLRSPQAPAYAESHS
jgi:hypothetical protein